MSQALTPRVSVVVPCFRSGPWLAELTRRIGAALVSAEHSYEIILVHDASGEATWTAIQKVCQSDSRVRGVDLLFNAGQHRATLCGLREARGEIVVTIDDDLEQPPEALPALIGRLERDPNCDCVIASFQIKGRGLLRRAGSALMARLFELLYHKPRHIQSTTFRALRRTLVDALLEHATVNPNVNPLIFRTTARLASLAVNHEPRAGGRSGYGLLRLARLMADNVLNVSTLPLKCVSVLGILAAILSILLSAWYLVGYLRGTVKQPGFATQVLLTLFFGGMTLFSIGLLGEYILRIMEEVRRPPRYVIRDRAGQNEQALFAQPSEIAKEAEL